MAGSNLLGSVGQPVRSTVGRIAIGVIALVLVAGAIVFVRTYGHGGAAPTSVASVASHAVPGPVPARAAAPLGPQVATASAPAGAAPAVVPVAPVRPAAVPARPVAGQGNGAPVVTAVAQGELPAAPNTAHLDDHLTYQYNALGRRDPFQSLVDGAFIGADVGGEAPPDPGGIKVVGIVWGATDQFALVEDVRGNSFVLRKGDKVQNGYVEGLKRDGVIVNITAEGQSQSVVIPLVRKGDQNAR